MRAAIFIDGGYFLKQIHNSNAKPNYQHLADFLLEPLRRKSDVDLMRCYFYYCAPYMSQQPTADENRRMEKHLKFVEELEALPRWQFRKGKLEKRREGDRDVFSQKRVDVKLSVDLVQHAAAGHIQHAIILAGDSDFIPAVTAAMEEGVAITLCAHNDRSAHRDLVKLVDEVRWIDWSSPSGGRNNQNPNNNQKQNSRPNVKEVKKIEVKTDKPVTKVAKVVKKKTTTKKVATKKKASAKKTSTRKKAPSKTKRTTSKRPG